MAAVSTARLRSASALAPFLLGGLLGALAGAPSHALGDALTGLDPNVAGVVDRYARDRMRSARIPGMALVIVKGDRIAYEKGYGRADPSGRAVTPETPFLIGSITKSFTALAVMQLADAGKVDLDASIQRYIPWFRVADPQASAQMTVRQLLTMTSGLPQLYKTQLLTDRDAGALERTVRKLAGVQLTGPVPHEFGYSNANYDTLGLIVQAVSGLPYEEYVKQEIFVPLDMRQSFVSQEEALRHGMASGYRWWFGLPVAVTMPCNRSELPAGYIIASAQDMGHYLIAQMNEGRYGDASVISPRGMAAAHVQPSANAYGMGWELLQRDGHRLFNHDGGTPNFQASLLFDPDARVGVFVAANALNGLDAFSSPSGESWLDGQTLRAIAQVVLSLATGRPLPDEGPGHRLLTLVFDAVILMLSALVVTSFVRLRGRYRRLTQRGLARPSELAWRAVAVGIVNFLVPVAVLALVLWSWIWKALVVQFEPDLAWWLYVVSLLLVVKGAIELGLLWRAAGQERPV